MLWRVRQGFRHFYQAALVFYTERGTTQSSFTVAHSFHQSTHSQCPPAVAPELQTPHHRRARSSNGVPPPKDVGHSHLKPNPKPKNKEYQKTDTKKMRHPTSTRLPQRLLAKIDTLYESTDMSPEELRTQIGDPRLLEYLQDRDKARQLAIDMVDTVLPQRALRVLHLAHHLGCAFKQNAYDGVAHRLAEAKYWRYVVPLVDLAKQHTGRTTVRLLNWGALALIQRSDFARLGNVLQWFAEAGLQPTRKTYHLLISGHIRNRDLPKAREFIQNMEQAGIPVDATTHAIIISAYRSLGPDVTVQQQAFESMQKLDDRTGTKVLNSLLQLALDAHDLDGALRLLPYFDQDMAGTNPVVKSGQDTGGGGVSHEEVVSSNHGPTSATGHHQILSPDAATFTMLMNYLATRGDFDRVLLVLERMTSAGVQLDSTAVGALVRAHFLGNKAGSALRIIADIAKNDHQAGAHFNDLGLAFAGRSVSRHLLTGIPLTTHIFNALLQGMLALRGLNSMRVILRIMRIYKVGIDSHTVTILLSHMDSVERARPRDMIRLLRAISSSQIDLTLAHVNVILRAVLRREVVLTRRRRGWHRTLEGVRKGAYTPVPVPANKISDTAKSFDPLAGINLPRWMSYRALVRPLVRSLSSLGMRSDKVTLMLRIKHDAVVKSDMELAEATFRRMLARGMHPNEHHYCALMEGYTMANDMAAAVAIMKSAVRAGIKPNVVMYTILIVGYARQGKPREANRTFHEMVSAGINPDAAAIDAVASAYFAVGARVVARQVLLEYWPYLGPFDPELRSASLLELAQKLRTQKADPANRRARTSKQYHRMLRWKMKMLIANLKFMLSKGIRKIALKNYWNRRWNRRRSVMKGRRQVDNLPSTKSKAS